MLQQLEGTSTSSSTGSSAVAALADSGTQNSTGSSLQASFQRLMQDVKSAPGAGQILHATA
jgi:hypothetical protein